MAADRSFSLSLMALAVAVIGTVCFSPAAASPNESKRDIELNRCLSGVTEDCEFVIAVWMMFGEALPPSEECCSRLADMGRECHDLLVDWLLETGEYKGEPADVISRSNELWEFCAFDRGNPYGFQPEAPAPAPDAQF